MAESISSAFILSLRVFEDFVRKAQTIPINPQFSIPYNHWNDELGRLRLWAANIGAHQKGRSSLDFRLRDASHIRGQIVKLLEDLRQTCLDIDETMNTQHESDEDALLDREESESEIEQLYSDVKSIINGLFQMSMLVRKPARHDVVKESKMTNVSAFEPFDQDHVRNKYPEAEERLVQRLGLAMTQRRKYLKYRERHRLKLGSRIENVYDQISETGPSILTDTTAMNPGKIPPSFTDIRDDSSDSVSQTSFAPTLTSGGHIVMPLPPKEVAEGAPFECPYCFFVITVRTTHSWYQHVFEDLQPYICTVLDCPTPNTMYSSRHEWLRHLETQHRPGWDGQRNEGEKATQADGSATCPLCIMTVAHNKDLGRHLARHLQELALWVLPSYDNEIDESGSDGEIAQTPDLESNLGSSEEDPEGAANVDEWDVDVHEGRTLTRIDSQHSADGDSLRSTAATIRERRDREISQKAESERRQGEGDHQPREINKEVSSTLRGTKNILNMFNPFSTLILTKKKAKQSMATISEESEPSRLASSPGIVSMEPRRDAGPPRSSDRLHTPPPEPSRIKNSSINSFRTARLSSPDRFRQRRRESTDSGSEEAAHSSPGVSPTRRQRSDPLNPETDIYRRAREGKERRVLPPPVAAEDDLETGYEAITRMKKEKEGWEYLEMVAREAEKARKRTDNLAEYDRSKDEMNKQKRLENEERKRVKAEVRAIRRQQQEEFERERVRRRQERKDLAGTRRGEKA